MADLLAQSALNIKRTGLILVRDNHCVGTFSKSFAHNNCSALLLHLRRRCTCTSELCVLACLKAASQTIVLCNA